MMILGQNALPPPRAWQAQEHRLHIATPKHAIFADPRTGKTYVVADWLRDLLEHGIYTRAVISAPLRVCPVWVETLAQAGIPVLPLYDCSIDHARRVLRQRPWPGVVLINIDRLAPLRPLLAGAAQVFVLDECHQAKSPSAKRARAARGIAKAAERVRILTGTPVPNHYGDLWSSAVMVGAATETWTEWMERYTLRDTYFHSKVTAHINVAELEERVRGFATTVRRDEVFGPDEWVIVNREVELPENVRAMYRTLAKEWVLAEPDITAPSAITRLLRLRQLTGGFLPSSGESDAQTMSIHTAKIDALLGDLEEVFESGEKAVIFHVFRPEGDAVEHALRDRVPTFVINGDYDATASEEQRRAFIRTDGAAAIIVQIQSGGVGINLECASHALYLSRSYSFVDDKQSRDRVFAPGLPRTVTYYNAPNTVDAAVSLALSKKLSFHEAVRHADAGGMLALILGEGA